MIGLKYKQETGMSRYVKNLESLETLINEENEVEFEPLSPHPVIVDKSYLDWLEEKATINEKETNNSSVS